MSKNERADREKRDKSEVLPPDWHEATEPDTVVGPAGAKEIDPEDAEGDDPTEEHLKTIDELDSSHHDVEDETTPVLPSRYPSSNREPNSGQ